jgi:phenylalanyl-tRNA synthetase beta chain
MLVSWNWLKEYVRLDMSLEELERRLMMAGLNHESTTDIDGDIAIDLEVTSNRPDCLGHIGIAREVAVLFNRELKLPAAQPEEKGPPVAELTKVTVECPQLCPRYTARMIRGVKVGESPAWLKRRLKTIGIAAINNVVDITNYVLMECGQPLHAFDFAKLAGKQIVVREPRRGEKLEAIDHKAYELEAGMCIIADAQRPVGIGGVMGGAGTEISPATTDVLIEAAQFAPLSIRNTARRLKLFSDSSYRFERGIDPGGVDWASRRCCELIVQIAGGKLAQGVLDVLDGASPSTPAAPSSRGADRVLAGQRQPIALRFSQIKRILGIEVHPNEVSRILTALGNEQVATAEERIEVIPPSWRRDLEREIDLIEEVARIHGYDKIPEDVSVPMATSARTVQDRVLAKVRHVLTAAGFDEAMTISTVPEEWSSAFSPWTAREPLRTATPVIERANLLRRSLAPSLLAARRTNETLGNERIELFEIAKVYLPEDGLPVEELTLTLCSGGDFFAVKGVLEAVLEELNPAAALEVRDFRHELLSERAVELRLAGEVVGYLGELGAAGLQRFELRGGAAIAELKISALVNAAQLVRRYAPTPEFPAIHNDINLEVAETVRWGAIAEIVRRSAGELLESVRYQETYRNPRLAAEGRKKVLFQVDFRSSQGTLTHDQANAAHDRIVAACTSELGARRG